LLARIYPNGKADVNHYHAAGGMAFLIRELLSGGLLHEDVTTVVGKGLSRYAEEPSLRDNKVVWGPAPEVSLDAAVLRPVTEPFAPDGGLRLMKGRLGRGVIKISAVAAQHRSLRAPAVVFDSQQAVKTAFQAGELDRDFVAVVRFQGARANGMPELHQLTPLLGVLQDKGRHVALLTDGRMSGASGKVPAVIHLSPEALLDGPIAKIRTGDMIVIDANAGTLEIEVDDAEWAQRPCERPAPVDPTDPGFGTDIFGVFRQAAASAENGATVFGPLYHAAPGPAHGPSAAEGE